MHRHTSPIVPALRWTPGQGYGLDAPRVRLALEGGAPGFILFGGTARAAREAAWELRARAERPLLMGADLERGAGQQFQGATALPPLAALGDLGDLEAIRAAGALTGREAVALGVPWVFAPVADLDVEPDNPIVGTRSFGADPRRVARQVQAWIAGCLESDALPCVKHFPGHGRTRTDSHAELPQVGADREELDRVDLAPFRSALSAGVPSVMTAHVAYPALDATGAAATRSAAVVDGLLRKELGFDGVVVTDALVMEGAGDPSEAAVEALAAGVDLLLHPPEELDVPRLLRAAVAGGQLDPAMLAASAGRVDALVRRWDRVEALRSARRAAEEGGPSEREVEWGSAPDRDRALSWAVRALRARDWGQPLPGRVRVVTLDDDLGGPFPPPARDVFPSVLRDAGVEVAEDDAPSLLCVYGEPRAWKGRAGLSPEIRARVRLSRPGSVGVVVFGGPRILADVPPELPSLLAWGGEPLMQEAAARFLAGGPGRPEPQRRRDGG